jgi:hypothetical protein
MIGVGLIGGLGNQMFQYAAARAAAERLRCGLAVRGPSLRRRHVIPFLARALLPTLKGRARVHSEIGRVFPNATQSLMGIAIQVSGESYRQTKFPRTFAAPRPIDANGVGIEIFDARYFEIERHTWLTGFFESRKYFQDMEAEVSKWFEFPACDKAVIQQTIQTWPAPVERMAAIHVRRTDFITDPENKIPPLGDPELGIALPSAYYTKALSSLPAGLKFAVFSDDPRFARKQFADLDPWVSPGYSPVHDMQLMSSCRFQVIANSTFSWWAAWLNRIPNKLIIAPRFHIGWRIKKWYPADIKVDEWRYIDVH